MQEENKNVVCLYSRRKNQVKMRSDPFQVILCASYLSVISHAS